MTFTHSLFDFKADTCSARPPKAGSSFFFFNVIYQAGRDGVFLLMGRCAKGKKLKFLLCCLSGPLTVSWRCTTVIKTLGEVFTEDPLDGHWPVAQEMRQLL